MNTGRWPEPPPVTMATLPAVGAAARTIPRGPTRLSSEPCAATMPSSISSTNRSGSLRIFCTSSPSLRDPPTGLQALDRRRERGQAVLRVGEEHPRLRVRVELVVDAGVALAHRALDHDDRLRVVDIEDRHARHRRAGPAR